VGKESYSPTSAHALQMINEHPCVNKIILSQINVATDRTVPGGCVVKLLHGGEGGT
jgi:hypothetical protein